MPLVFAGISPHPPIVVEGIGSREDLIKASNTVMGLNRLASRFREAEVETLIIISPHGLVYPDRFNICGMKKLFGSFAHFDAPEIMIEAKNDFELANEIDQKAAKSELATLLYDNEGEFYEMDHGLMVPLTYLSKNADETFGVVPLAYSELPRSDHFSFGQVLQQVAKASPKRIGILASGDLSHRLLQNPAGKKFDQKLIKDLGDNNVKEILYYDEDFVEEAGECGYRSILILLGVLDGENPASEILSYEGPFGVGYGVINYKLRSNQ